LAPKPEARSVRLVLDRENNYLKKTCPFEI